LKRISPLMLLLATMMLLTACSFSKASNNTVSFYYPRTEPEYHEKDSVITIEEREIAGNTEDLNYILSLYMIGPLDDTLTSPLPKGSRLYSVIQENGSIRIILSDLDKTLNDVHFSLAAACLSLTCMDCAGAEEVTVQSGERTVQLSREDILLVDTTSEIFNSLED